MGVTVSLAVLSSLLWLLFFCVHLGFSGILRWGWLTGRTRSPSMADRWHSCWVHANVLLWIQYVICFSPTAWVDFTPVVFGLFSSRRLIKKHTRACKQVTLTRLCTGHSLLSCCSASLQSLVTVWVTAKYVVLSIRHSNRALLMFLPRSHMEII